jgi:collagenase-like PrtC family protease
MSSYLVYKEWSDEEDDALSGTANRGARGCARVCQAGWDVAESDGELAGKSTLRDDPFLQLWELPGFVEAGVDYLKLQGRERSEELMQDITRFYRRLIDAILDRGTDLSLQPFVPEWQELRKRWMMERTRRVGLLLGSVRQTG